MTSRTGELGFVGLLVLFVTGVSSPSAPARAQGPGRLDVKAVIEPTRVYVGQATTLTVTVPGASPGTGVTPPKLDGISISILSDGTALGRFRLVPRRAGTFTIPPISVAAGGRSGVSRPLRLVVKAPPEAGRPAEFFGGVGEFNVSAGVSSAQVRVGEPFVYTLTVTGPAAEGADSPPPLVRLKALPLALTVERRPDESVVDPPSHAFSFRLRATQPGRATLPPVTLAALDPKTGRYMTRVAPGVPVVVVEVPPFDPATLDLGPRPSEARGRWTWVFNGVLAILLATAVILGSFRAGRGWTHGRGHSARRLLTQVHTKIKHASNDQEGARAFAEGLAAYLAVLGERSGAGALTPEEAEHGLMRATQGVDLALRAGRLIAECDAAQFGGGGVANVRPDCLAFVAELTSAPVVVKG